MIGSRIETRPVRRPTEENRSQRSLHGNNVRRDKPDLQRVALTASKSEATFVHSYSPFRRGNLAGLQRRRPAASFWWGPQSPASFSDLDCEGTESDVHRL